MRHFGGDEPALRLVGVVDERRPGEVVSALEWAEIRALTRDGVSQRLIAKRLAISRRTVASVLAADAPPRYRDLYGNAQGRTITSPQPARLRSDTPDALPLTPTRQHGRRAIARLGREAPQDGSAGARAPRHLVGVDSRVRDELYV